MRCVRLVLSLCLVIAVATPIASAAKPADPKLIPAGRKLLARLEAVYGKHVIAGQNKTSLADEIHEATGSYPAIVNFDLSGWSKTRWDYRYRKNLARTIAAAKKWHDRGGVVTFTWHWANPLTGAGTYQATKRKVKPKIDVGKAVTSGTPEHKAVMKDLAKHADYLEKLAKAGIPVLWRPLHEIDGGWFWWTDPQTPENTAKLWRMMFDYLTSERDLHNLIWVYSAGLKAAAKGKDDVAAVEYRRRFYPGAEYVDISGIDIYPNSYFGWEDYRKDAYKRAFEFMQKVSPGKMLALSECGGAPSPETMAEEGPKWLYFLPWWAGGKKHPTDWIKRVYGHSLVMTLEEWREESGQSKAR